MGGALRPSELQCHLPLQAPLLLMNLSASSARGSDSGSPTCAHEKCVWMCKTLLCLGTSVGYKGQGETRHTALPTIHCRYLLFRISSAPGNIQSNHMLPHWPKVFGGFPFLDFLIGPFFLMFFFFSCSEEMKQFP